MEHTELCTSLGTAWGQLGDGLEQDPIRTHLRHAWRWAHAICIQAEQKAQREARSVGRHRRPERVGPRAEVFSELTPAPDGGVVRRVWRWVVPNPSGGVNRGVADTWRGAMAAVWHYIGILRGETYADRWARRSGHPVGSGPVARHAAGDAAELPTGRFGPSSRPRHADGAPVAGELPEALAYRAAAGSLARPAPRRDRTLDNRGVSASAGSALASLDQEQFWSDLGRAAA